MYRKEKLNLGTDSLDNIADLSGPHLGELTVGDTGVDVPDPGGAYVLDPELSIESGKRVRSAESSAAHHISELSNRVPTSDIREAASEALAVWQQQLTQDLHQKFGFLSRDVNNKLVLDDISQVVDEAAGSAANLMAEADALRSDAFQDGLDSAIAKVKSLNPLRTEKSREKKGVSAKQFLGNIAMSAVGASVAALSGDMMNSITDAVSEDRVGPLTLGAGVLLANTLKSGYVNRAKRKSKDISPDAYQRASTDTEHIVNDEERAIARHQILNEKVVARMKASLVSELASNDIDESDGANDPIQSMVRKLASEVAAEYELTNEKQTKKDAALFGFFAIKAFKVVQSI